MSTSKLEGLFLVLQNLIFKQIGKKIRTNALKTIMDVFFIIFEKVGCKFDIISNIYMLLYQEIVTKEITVAQISSQDRVLVIGSGSLPATPALIVQNTHARTISIDKDCNAVKEAIQYVKNHQLDDLLSIQCADGLTYPLEQFSIILVLYGVKKPAEMLRHLANSIDRNTRVLYRTITDSHGKIMDKTIDLSEGYQIKDHVHSEAFGSFDSFLLIKK